MELDFGGSGGGGGVTGELWVDVLVILSSLKRLACGSLCARDFRVWMDCKFMLLPEPLI